MNPSIPPWIVINLNRKGTVMYFGPSPTTNQLWTPSPQNAATLTKESADQIAKDANGLTVSAGILQRVKPQNLANTMKSLWGNRPNAGVPPVERYEVESRSRSSVPQGSRHARTGGDNRLKLRSSGQKGSRSH